MIAYLSRQNQHVRMLAMTLFAVLGIGANGALNAQYSLTVESAPAVGTGGVVYRFYVNAENPTDQLSAVFGTDEYNLILETPAGIFNSPYNSSWNASGVNPAFLPVFPDLADDSFATIGLDGPAASSGLAGAADPSIVEDATLSPTVSGYFTSGGTGLNVNTLTGASWYVLNTAANSYPVDGRWLIMQITTAGSISGQINYQVFPLGVGADQLQLQAEFSETGTFVPNDGSGCTDMSACNYDAAATSDDGSCTYCDCTASSSGYLLVVDEQPAIHVPGATRYQFRVQMPNAGDQMSAVFGVDTIPLVVNAPMGIFNSGYNSSWNASGINPAFVGVFPDLVEDSYATIGLEGPASSSGLAQAADPTLVQDPTQPIDAFFITDGADSLMVNSIIGGSWFNLNTAENTYPDANNQVLIMQLTSTGEVSGTVNVQVLPEGVTGIGNDVQKTFHFNGSGVYAAVGDGNACGCTDVTACNYDASATYDDGSCAFDDAIGTCGGDCLADADGDGVCDDEDGCVGSLDACGVCDGPGAIYECGCTDVPAGDCDCNGNQQDALGVCGGACLADVDGDGICDDTDDCVGSVDACGVCNGPGEIYACGCTDIPAGDCDCNGNQLDAAGVCGGDCTQDSDGDGICDDVDTCTGQLDACGVCNGPGAIYECGCADIPAGDCDCEGNQATEFVDCDGACLQDVDADGVCDDVDTCIDLEGPSWLMFPPNDTISCDEMMPTVEETMPVAQDDCDSVEVVWLGDGPFEYPFGCLQSYTCPRVYQATDGAGNVLIDTLVITVLDTVAPELAYPTETDVFVNELLGEVVPNMEAFVIDNCDSNADYNATEVVLSESNGVLILQRTYTAADACGNTTVFQQTITVTQAFEGCTDENACNFDSEANLDDDSCTYAEEGLDCEGNCLSDEDGDGYCDPEVTGCIDPTACNYSELATEDDGSCEFCSCLGESQAGYGILLEVHAEHTEGTLAGLTTYRMYVTTPNDNDIMSAVYGDDSTPLLIATTTSFYQHPFGASLGSGNNPMLFPSFPELEFDSWLTMGLDAPAGANEIEPSTIGDINNGWISNFEAGMNVVIEDSIGGAMFVTNDPGMTNIVSGADQRILIGQFTTDGDMSGVVNVQMFTQGVVDPADRVSLEFDGVGLSDGLGDAICGCTDESACNFNPDANSNDGSCEYESCAGCTDATACNFDEAAALDDGSCEFESCAGCTDATACNYDESALIDDGSCEFESCAGCTDATACNYNELALIDDGSCEYPEFLCVACDGTCLIDEDNDGICDCQEFPGCTDPLACNYDPIYTEDAGNCYYAEEYYDCNGNCLCDNDGDGVCCELEVFGCTDAEFCNYNPEATEDDGSCGEGDQVNDVCEGAMPLACGESVLANNEECASVDEVLGCADAQPTSPTAGLWYSFMGTGGEVTVSTCYPGTTIDTYLSVYEGACGSLTCVGGNDDQSEPFYNDLCPVYTFASTVVLNTTAGVEYLVLVSGVFDDVGDFEVGVACTLAGCMDEFACNFDPLATEEDGSCTYPEDEYLDCDGLCLNDADSDGVCDEVEVFGCTDESASNYNDLATEEDGSCSYCDLVLSVSILQGLTCEGDQNAVVELLLTGVLYPDSLGIFLNDEPQDTTVFEGLSAGSYTVEVHEGVACSAVVNFVVEDGLALDVSLTATDVLCPGGESGELLVTVNNGASPYEFVLDGPATGVNGTGEFTGLSAGTYLVVATDANGCSGASELEVGQPDDWDISADVTDAAELGAGAIDLTVSGGTAPYEFDWFDGGTFSSDEEDPSNLNAPATYSVTVTDANGCQTEAGPYEVDDVYSVFVHNEWPIDVYPNPASDWIQFNLTSVEGHADMSIFDAAGRVVWSESFRGGPGLESLDVSSWPSGTYHLHVLTAQGVGHAPLVIQR